MFPLGWKSLFSKVGTSENKSGLYTHTEIVTIQGITISTCQYNFGGGNIGTRELIPCHHNTSVYFMGVVMKSFVKRNNVSADRLSCNLHPLIPIISGKPVITIKVTNFGWV